MEVKGFFSRFSDPLLDFANQHGMSIEKYWHGFPSWRFIFKHPKTGTACIEVFREGQGLQIYSNWWFDDYDRGTRFSRTFKAEILDVDEVGMPGLLRDTLEEILSWPLNSWTNINEGLGESWRRSFSKKEFAALDDQYPTLKMHAHL